METISLLRNYLLHLFDIKEDEFKKTVLLQLNIFLIITTLLVVKPTVNSLFLSELTSDALPLGYVLTAIAAIVGSLFYNKALEVNPLNKIIEWTLIGSVISLLLFGVLFKYQLIEGVFLYIPYIWVAIFGLLAASQFWVLANLVYNIREAKRIFGFIGAGAIAGGIFGGYVTSILTRFFNVEDLLFVAACLLFICIPIVRYIWKSEVLKLNTFQVAIRSESSSGNPLKLIRQSKLLSLIALVIGLSVLVAKLVDYQYSDYASTIIEDPEKLASFFGFWFSTLSLVSLLVQLFLTKRIVGMMGVGKSLLWLPSGVLLGSVLLLIIPQLWVIVFIKVVDGSLKQSVNKAATELLSIPIPIDIKKKTKTFIDVVIDSISTGLAGFILIFFINGLNIPSKYVSIIIISLICIWIYLILKLKKEYIDSFKHSLISVSEKKKTKIEIPVTSIVDSVIRVFKSGTENQIAYMLKRTTEVKDDRFFEDFTKLLEHPSAKIRALAIENLYLLGGHNLSHKIEPMIYDSDQKVTTSAFRYLLNYYQGDKIQLLEKYFNTEDHTISNAALLGLSLELRDHEELQEKYKLIKKIETALKLSGEIEDPLLKKNKILAILEAVGNARVTWHYSFIEKHLAHLDPDIANVATISASKTLNAHFIDIIIENLSKKELRVNSIIALYNYGEKIIDDLTQKAIDRNIKIENARHIPAIIEKFTTQKAVLALIRLIENTDHEVKIEAIESLSRLKWKNKDLDVKDRLIMDKILDECELYYTTLAALHSQILVQSKKENNNLKTEEENSARNGLIKLIEGKLDKQLQRIFKFLGLKFPPNEIDPILNIILDGKEEQRIHAIEFLDNILDSQLKKELIPIAETTMIDITLEGKMKKLKLSLPSEKECYKNLLKLNDNKLRQAVLYLIEKTNDKRFILLAKEYINSSNSNLKKQAISTVKHLSKN